MTLTVTSYGTKVVCEACGETIAKLVDERINIRVGRQIVIAHKASVSCRRCGHMNHIRLTETESPP